MPLEHIELRILPQIIHAPGPAAPGTAVPAWSSCSWSMISGQNLTKAICTVIYSCSPQQVIRILWTVYETVSCMNQLCTCYALRTFYSAHASLLRQRQALYYALLQLPSLPLSCTGYNFLVTRRGEQDIAVLCYILYCRYIKEFGCETCFCCLS